MQEVIFDLQIVTPLFIAGADYKPVPIPFNRQQGKYTRATEGWDLQGEIRPPSFRGLMRYWLRAAVGGLADTTRVSLKDVVQFEESIFGATDRGSAINVRVADISKKSIKFEKDKESFSQESVTGKDYLLWSMAKSGNGKDYKPSRWYFPEGTTFKVILSERSLDPAAPQALPHAIASMWLLTSLGGIGSRSHRCAGSLAVRSVMGNTSSLSFTEVTGKGELQAMLQQGIAEIHKLSNKHLQELGKQGKSEQLTTASFDSLLLPGSGDLSLSPHTCRIWILAQDSGSPWKSQKDAMDTIGAKLKTYRSSLKPEERAVFGLPLNIKPPPRDRDLEKALKDNRRASPLLLRITKLHSGYVGIAVLFKTYAAPIFTTDARNKRLLIPAPDYTHVEKWITDYFPLALEVKL